MTDNNTPYRITDIDRVRSKMLDGTVRTLDAVRYIPNLRRNIISLSTFGSKGYMYTVEGEILKVIEGARVMLMGHRKFHLYNLQGDI